MNWRRLRTLMRREVRATFRSAFTVTVLITVPIAALLAFGFILSTEVRGLGLGVLDGDGSAVSRRIVADLENKGIFEPRTYTARAALDRAMVRGDISVAMVIPPSFEQDRRAPRDGRQPAQIQIVYDGSEAVLAGNAEGFLRAILAATLADVALPQTSLPSIAAPAPVEVLVRAVANPRLDGKPFMVCGTFGFVLSFLTVLITAVSIVNEKLGGTFEQLQVTPATGVEILLGKILPLGAIFAFDVLLMAVIAGTVLNVWPEGSLVFFFLVSAFYVLVSLGLGIIISATSATAAEAVQKSILFSIPLVQLSGFAFPIRNMPTVVQWVAEIFPATHYIRISRAIYLRGEGPLTLFPELGLLLLFGALVVAYALRSIEARA